MKSDRLRCLTYILEYSKYYPEQFWKYVTKFRNRDTDLLQLEFVRTSPTRPSDIAEAFSKYFQSVCGSCCSGTLDSFI
jgi:hypothetical protein